MQRCILGAKLSTNQSRTFNRMRLHEVAVAFRRRKRRVLFERVRRRAIYGIDHASIRDCNQNTQDRSFFVQIHLPGQHIGRRCAKEGDDGHAEHEQAGGDKHGTRALSAAHLYGMHEPTGALALDAQMCQTETRHKFLQIRMFTFDDGIWGQGASYGGDGGAWRADAAHHAGEVGGAFGFTYPKISNKMIMIRRLFQRALSERLVFSHDGAHGGHGDPSLSLNGHDVD
jgi:hypothetical protein